MAAPRPKYQIGETVTYPRLKPRYQVSRVLRRKSGMLGGGGVEYELSPAERTVVAKEGDIKRLNPTSPLGIQIIVGHPKGSLRTKVQSVLFDADHWTEARAKAWLKRHKFKYGQMDAGGPNARHLRFRQWDPAGFVAGSFRTVALGSNPTPLLLHSLVGGLGAGVGLALGAEGVQRALPLRKTEPAATTQNPSRNPIIEGELVRVPSLDTTATVKEIIKEKGGLLGGGATKYRVEYELGGQTKKAIVPARSVKRLNPGDMSWKEWSAAWLKAAKPRTQVEARQALKDAAATYWEIKRKGGLRISPTAISRVAERNPVARLACPSCRASLRVPSRALEMRCSRCGARLGVNRS